METIVTTNTQTRQPVVVKKVVKVYKKRNIITFLSSVIFLLCLFIVFGAIFAFATWIHTFKVFTEEKVVAELIVSPKVIKNGKPTFTVKYIPKDDVSGWWGIFGSEANSTDKEIEAELVGDRFMVESDFISWNNWLTFLNVKPVYKINRITPGYFDAEDYNKYGVDVLDINGGPDQTAVKVRKSEKKYTWFIDRASISGDGNDVQDEERIYEVKVSKDTVKLELK